MKNTGRDSVSKAAVSQQALGDFAYSIIAEQFRRIMKREKQVLEDKEPEHLHQMRVGTRRLRTALQIFDRAIVLPKVARANYIRDLARVLGAVRDMDVQLADLQNNYQPQLEKQEQKDLKQVVKALEQQRVAALEQMKATLKGRSYKALKAAYESWLEKPEYQPIANLSLAIVLPDVLSPLLSEVLLHPGWLVERQQISTENGERIHDLRKLCKQARYQTEFFSSFYGEEFQIWIDEIKAIQDRLGVFQDTQVLQALLVQVLGQKTKLPTLQQLIQQKQTEALSQWEATRQKYLDSGFRYHLHQILLQPTVSTTAHPDLIELNPLINQSN
ncbi:MAG TPA: CHAD domain-containing protein [Trichocoleus sp.]|jgi:CHAD domain-containing protein